MASEFTWSAGMLGRVIDDHGHDIQVGCTPGHVHLVIGYPGGELLVRLSGERQAMFRELLDRAAMPGQAQAVTDGGVLMCATPGDCPNGPEPHAFIPDNEEVLPCCRQPWEPPALTVAAVTPALAERMGEIADAAQEVPPCPAP